jgi:hypothetical protein
VLFVLVGLTLAVTVAVFGVGMAVPVAAVVTAIYRLPALSFMRAWPGEVIAAVTMPFVIAFLASVFPFAGLALVDALVFGYDYAASHQAYAVAATIGAVVGGLYGACMSFVGAVAAGLDEPD